MSNNTARLLALLLAGSALSACSIVPGNEDFSCPGGANIVRCKSARDIYDMTTGRDDLSSVDPNDNGDKSGETSERQSGPIEAVPRQVVPTPVTAEYGRVPIRTPARVMRIWVGPWETEDGDLAVGGLLYVEIEPKRWQIGQAVGDTNVRNMAPLTDQFNAKQGPALVTDPKKQQAGSKAPMTTQNATPVSADPAKAATLPISGQKQQ